LLLSRDKLVEEQSDETIPRMSRISSILAAHFETGKPN